MLTSFICLSHISCSDSDKQASEAKPVSHITYEQRPGSVLFQWENPEDFSYVEILYQIDTDAAELQRVIVQSPVSEQLIYGLPDTNEREYTFIAHRNELSSEAVKIKAQAGMTPFDKLANSIQTSVNLEGVRVSWNNEEEGEYYLNMNIDEIKADPDYEIVIKETGSGERQIPISGMLTADLLFTVSDIYGNESTPVFRNYKKLENGWLDRSIWSVVDFSSQEEANEQDVGGHLNSRATCVLDGYTNTFWHSRWASNQTGYPHYITFDLQRLVNLYRARIVRRLNNTNLNTFEIQGGPSKDGPWTRIVEYTIRTTNNSQTIEFPEGNHQYRYIRFYCTRGTSGNIHASLAEFELYGQDIEEE